MMGSGLQKNDGVKPKEILVILIVIISLISITTFALSTDLIGIKTDDSKKLDAQQTYTTYFTNIAPQDANALINNNSDIIIVDVRSCECDYDKGHLPNAIWAIDPIQFYNTTSDILIYCSDGSISVSFCQQLINHIYGELYFLRGGFNSWENAGYEITKLS